MWRRDARSAADDLAAECEAFLAGRYPEYLTYRGRPVPAWAWTNPLAHASEDQLRTMMSTRGGAMGSAGGLAAGVLLRGRRAARPRRAERASHPAPGPCARSSRARAHLTPRGGALETGHVGRDSDGRAPGPPTDATGDRPVRGERIQPSRELAPASHRGSRRGPADRSHGSSCLPHFGRQGRARARDGAPGRAPDPARAGPCRETAA